MSEKVPSVEVEAIVSTMEKVAHESAEAALAGSGIIAAEKTTLVKAFDKELDQREGSLYEVLMKKISYMADFSFSRYETAYRYGVDVSDLTPEFFAEKRKIAEKEFEEAMDQFEKENGFRPSEITPEEVKEIERSMQKAKDNYRKSHPKELTPEEKQAYIKSRIQKSKDNYQEFKYRPK